MPPQNPFGPQNPFSLANNMRHVNEYGYGRAQQEARAKTQRSPTEAFKQAEEKYAKPPGGEAPKSHSQPQPRTAMGKAEALGVLGLTRGATADAIRAAHKRLIKSVHPSLATKIKQAKDVLLRD